MLCRFTADGTILFANTAYARMMESPRAALTGRNVWKFIPTSEHATIQREMALLTPENPSRTIENRLETADGSVRWTLWRNHALEFDAQGRWQVMQSTGIDITERKILEDRLRLLIEELNHRVKNSLMVVQAMAWQSFRGIEQPAAAAVENFTARLHALAAAHTILSRGQWAGAPLADVVRQGLTICAGSVQGDGGAQRLSLGGPDVTVGAAATVSLVMVLHELATNAIKYGALSCDSGNLSLTWQTIPAENRVELLWHESGGPAVRQPDRKGFGTTLIERALPRTGGNRVDLYFAPAGVQCRISLALRA